jgi:AcrR family transcriptional regulator
VPHGSTTYWFKTRDQLIEAAVERMVDVDRERAAPIGEAVTHALARRGGTPDMTAVADAIVDWIESDRAIQLARYEVAVAGGRDERLRAIMSQASQHFWRLAEPIAIAMGSDDPKRDARVLVAMLDGLQFDYLTREPADVDAFRAGVQRLLTGAFEK